MCVNTKIIPVETVSGISQWGMKESISGGGEFKYDISDTL
jgi:hypothetical protein